MDNWPEYFPRKCPPADARRDDIKVFRLVAESPPSPADFRPTVVEYPHRNFESDKCCAACGVSVFRDVNDIIKKMGRYKALRDKKIAVGRISQEDGLVLETFEASHITWWLQTLNPHLSIVEFDGHAER
jgi:hypothetical protein